MFKHFCHVVVLNDDKKEGEEIAARLDQRLPLPQCVKVNVNTTPIFFLWCSFTAAFHSYMHHA